MKNNNFIIAIFILLTSSIFAQNKTEDVFGVQLGLVGGWIHYEKSLSKKITVNGSVGYAGALMQGTTNNLDYIFTTTIGVQPRYYYNLDKRVEQGKNISNNSANFLALDLFYVPDWGTSSNRRGVGINKSFAIIPEWGLRRNIADKLYFQFAAGIGYQFAENHNSGVALGLDLKIGYRIK